MVTPCCFTESAKKRTVAGGTSPTAVTLCPSTTVENAEDVPTVADSSSFAGCAPLVEWASTNTETEAIPSVNTR